MLNILIVEDHPVVSEATSELLTDLESAACVSVAASVIEARAAIERERHWNTVLLDLDVPGAQGLSLARELCAAGLAGRTCIVTAFQKPGYVAEAKALGFLGFIYKSFPVEEFTAALRRVLRGEQAFPSVEGEARPLTPVLTKRQQRILQLIGTGMLSKQSAHHLGISEGTVNNHVSALFRALGVGSRLQAHQRAVDLGLVDHGGVSINRVGDGSSGQFPPT